MSRERRGVARLYVGVEGAYRRTDGPEKKARVLVQDISISGVRFIAGEAFSENTALEFSLHIPDLSVPIDARGKVIWQKRFSESFYDTGIEFTELVPDSKEKLSAYIQGALGRISEHREFIRCNLSTMIHFWPDGDQSQEQRGITVDVSPTGLKILARHALQKGDKLRLRFHLPEKEMPIAAEAQVIWNRINSDNFCEAGIEFTEIDQACVELINQYIRHTLGIDW